MNPATALSITSQKLDGSFRFELEVELLHASPTVLLGLGRPGRLVKRRDSVNRPDNWSLEYLPLDRPYNIVSVFDPAGQILYHFCNVLTAARYDPPRLSYVDLDLDLVVWPDGGWELQDRDEFEANARRMSYPPALRSLAEEAADELVGLAASGSHLFRCRELEEARSLLLRLYAS